MIVKKLGFYIGLFLAVLLFYVSVYFGLSFEAAVTASVTGLCAVWWVLEVIPIPVTSIIPFAVFPFFGVVSHKEIANSYGHTIVLLLLGGFILASALEKNGAHKRLALAMVKAVGGKGGKRLVLGFMVAAGIMSMWISNTATTLMLLPVAMAVISQSNDKQFSLALLLGLAYAANIGGVATPIGTPTNLIFMGIYKEATSNTISFLDWMVIGLPVFFMVLPIIWLVVTRKVRGAETLVLPEVGLASKAEKRILLVFFVTALAWIFRAAPYGGWSGLVGIDTVGDSTIALLAVVLVFLIPDGEGGKLLDWKTAEKIPWGLLILFGGGIAIAKAFQATGLSLLIGEMLSGLASYELVLVIWVICISVSFLTELTSNVATTTLLMPILAAAALAVEIDPKLFMIPATISASCAFMLPVATAPNAIIFGTERVRVMDMVKTGLVINVLASFVVTAAVALLI